MAKGRAVAIVLESGEQSEPAALTRKHGAAQALAERARIVLAAADGLNNKEIAAKVGVCAATAGTWRNRFAQSRMDGLYDEPRPGAPREIGDDEVAATIRKTLETLPPGATNWSLRSMAKEIGRRDSRNYCRQVHAPAPSFGVPQVPRRGRAQRANRSRHGTHKTKLIRNWFAKRPRWHVHSTPTSASWINQVERFFALLTDRALKRGIFRSVAELETAINAYIEATNAEPQPFRWTETADDILASIQRFCLRTLEANA